MYRTRQPIRQVLHTYKKIIVIDNTMY